jgi:hypothetical protein
MTAIDVDGEDAADGLLALVVAVVELLVEAMEREGVRRMESGQLSDEEVERLGRQFQSLEAEIDEIKETAGIGSEVDDVRSQLGGLVGDALRSVDAGTPVGRETVPDPSVGSDGGQR